MRRFAILSLVAFMAFALTGCDSPFEDDSKPAAAVEAVPSAKISVVIGKKEGAPNFLIAKQTIAFDLKGAPSLPVNITFQNATESAHDINLIAESTAPANSVGLDIAQIVTVYNPVANKDNARKVLTVTLIAGTYRVFVDSQPTDITIKVDDTKPATTTTAKPV